MSLYHHTLRERFALARRERGARHRDIALELGIPEGELIAAHVGPFSPGPAEAPAAESPLHAMRLRADWPALLAELESVGEVMALTRNEHCVHEKVGTYRNASHQGLMGLVLGDEIDLRVFYRHWTHGFALREQTASGAQRSLQFLDAAGQAIHKVFAKPQTDAAAWDALLQRWRDESQTTGLDPAPLALVPPAAERPDAEIDVEALHSHWASMRDTHEFFPLLRRHGVSRTQALRLAEPRFAQAVEPDSASQLLIAAAQSGASIMVFAGNPGMLQIHTGAVHKVARMGPWINVLDAGFNLHLREDAVTQAWLVRKPTADGIVSSLELFDADGRTIAMLFGERKPGRPERGDWRGLLAQLQVLDAQPEAASCATL